MEFLMKDDLITYNCYGRVATDKVIGLTGEYLLLDSSVNTYKTLHTNWIKNITHINNTLVSEPIELCISDSDFIILNKNYDEVKISGIDDEFGIDSVYVNGDDITFESSFTQGIVHGYAEYNLTFGLKDITHINGIEVTLPIKIEVKNNIFLIK